MQTSFPAIIPAGTTTVVSVGQTATSATIVSLVPVCNWHFTNASSNPIQIRLDPIRQQTAVFPTAGNPTLGPVLNANDDLVIGIPAVLTTATQNGFVTTIYISAISNTAALNSLYITPVQV
jgi:hypothetical protein